MNVAVLGGGIMGNGIAQVSAMAGHDASVLDVGEVELERTRAAIEKSLARLERKKHVTPDERETTMSRLSFGTEMADVVGKADIVIEAVPEQLELKQEVFARVVEHAPAGCLLASNTSHIPISAIGAKLGATVERLVGMHFFNPPVMMNLVELIASEWTSAETLEEALAFARGLGKETVICHKDAAGFITTRCSVILRLECLRILEAGIASPEDIDKALRLGFNHPMGPLELGDLVGLDTFLFNADALAKEHGERFKAPDFVRELVESGRYGRKTGGGIYDYDADGNRVVSDDDAS